MYPVAFIGVDDHRASITPQWAASPVQFKMKPIQYTMVALSFTQRPPDPCVQSSRHGLGAVSKPLIRHVLFFSNAGRRLMTRRPPVLSKPAAHRARGGRVRTFATSSALLRSDKSLQCTSTNFGWLFSAWSSHCNAPLLILPS